MNYSESLDYLDKLQKSGIKLGLSNTFALLERVGNPQQKTKFLHIAGSNGKGSTGALLDSALRCCGKRTGFYTSPHLVSVRERIRIDGKAIGDAQFAELVTQLARQSEGINSTYFEFLTGIAAMAFARGNCEWVVWETGMGGRFDSTNTVVPECSIITNIALDHRQYLGDTIAQIAFEKAGIIKEERPVFVNDALAPEAMEVIRRRAQECHAPLTVAEVPRGTSRNLVRDNRVIQQFESQGEQVELGLPGAMQRRNYALADAVTRYLKLDRAGVLRGFAQVRWPGRMDVFDRYIIDGGHNPDGLAALAEGLAEVFPGERFSVVFGNYRDKDPAGLRSLIPAAERFFFVPLGDSLRGGRTPEELAEVLHGARPAQLCESLGDGIERAKGSPQRILIAGSLYLAGEAFRLLAPPEKVLDLI
ncbi:MAG: bifunctional folylpolyglutamate synthase/dihydrofolate synthase [Victivallaceae bacterium]|nr:bifunctional folylpolyglutamate synthase/dihydrofolate synthase [Victivallaceae bacterium]